MTDLSRHSRVAVALVAALFAASCDDRMTTRGRTTQETNIQIDRPGSVAEVWDEIQGRPIHELVRPIVRASDAPHEQIVEILYDPRTFNGEDVPSLNGSSRGTMTICTADGRCRPRTVWLKIPQVGLYDEIASFHVFNRVGDGLQNQYLGGLEIELNGVNTVGIVTLDYPDSAMLRPFGIEPTGLATPQSLVNIANSIDLHTVGQIQRMREFCDQNNIQMRDFQVLVNEAGQARIGDPGFFTHVPEGGVSGLNRRYAADLVSGAVYAKQQVNPRAARMMLSELSRVAPDLVGIVKQNLSILLPDTDWRLSLPERFNARLRRIMRSRPDWWQRSAAVRAVAWRWLDRVDPYLMVLEMPLVQQALLEMNPEGNMDYFVFYGAVNLWEEQIESWDPHGREQGDEMPSFATALTTVAGQYGLVLTRNLAVTIAEEESGFSTPEQVRNWLINRQSIFREWLQNRMVDVQDYVVSADGVPLQVLPETVARDFERDHRNLWGRDMTRVSFSSRRASPDDIFELTDELSMSCDVAGQCFFSPHLAFSGGEGSPDNGGGLGSAGDGGDWSDVPVYDCRGSACTYLDLVPTTFGYRAGSPGSLWNALDRMRGDMSRARTIAKSSGGGQPDAANDWGEAAPGLILTNDGTCQPSSDIGAAEIAAGELPTRACVFGLSHLAKGCVLGKPYRKRGYGLGLRCKTDLATASKKSRHYLEYNDDWKRSKKGYFWANVEGMFGAGQTVQFRFEGHGEQDPEDLTIVTRKLHVVPSLAPTVIVDNTEGACSNQPALVGHLRTQHFCASNLPYSGENALGYLSAIGEGESEACEGANSSRYKRLDHVDQPGSTHGWSWHRESRTWRGELEPGWLPAGARILMCVQNGVTGNVSGTVFTMH